MRELRNVIERLALLAEDDRVDVPTLEELREPSGRRRRAPEIDRMRARSSRLPERLGSKLDVIERAVLHHAIESCGGNKSAAARLIGVDRKALERRWERLSDAPPERHAGQRFARQATGRQQGMTDRAKPHVRDRRDVLRRVRRERDEGAVARAGVRVDARRGRDARA